MGSSARVQNVVMGEKSKFSLSWGEITITAVMAVLFLLLRCSVSALLWWMASRNVLKAWTKPTKQSHPCLQSTCRQSGWMGKVLACSHNFQPASAPFLFAVEDVEAIPRMSECCQEEEGSPQEGGRVGAVSTGATKYRRRERQELPAGGCNLALALRGGGQGHPCCTSEAQQWHQSFLSCCNLGWHLQAGKLISLSLSVDHLRITNLSWCCPKLLPLLSCVEKVCFCMHWNTTVMKIFKKISSNYNNFKLNQHSISKDWFLIILYKCAW